MFDGLVRGVLASAELKTLATEVYIASVGQALKKYAGDLSYREYSHLIQICSPELP